MSPVYLLQSDVRPQQVDEGENRAGHEKDGAELLSDVPPLRGFGAERTESQYQHDADDQRGQHGHVCARVVGNRIDLTVCGPHGMTPPLQLGW